MKVYGKYFYGNEISAYGLEHNRVDYGTLAKAFDAVLNNYIMSETMDIGYWEQESGFIDNSDEIEELKKEIEELNYKYHASDDDNEKEEIHDKINELLDEIDELEEEENYYPDVYQSYIVDDRGAEILKECNEIVWYNDVLDMYVWGVTHYGTSWDYVLTNIECNTGNV